MSSACRTSAVPQLLALLNHENSDIAADAVEVLSELTDHDAVEDAVGGPWLSMTALHRICNPAGSHAVQEEGAAALVDSLLANDALNLLVHRLGVFDEKVPEEAAAVYNVLSTIENIVEVKPDAAEAVLEKTEVRARDVLFLRPCFLVC